MGIFLEGEDSHGDHGLGRLVEFRFKATPGTTSSSITTHHQDNLTTPHGRPNLRSRLHSCHAQEGGPRSPQRTCGGTGPQKKNLAPSSILREAKVAYYARNMFEAGRFVLFFVKAT